MGAKHQIREHGTGTILIGRRGPGDDGGDAAEDLGADEGEDDVEAGERLEEDHAEADTLKRVQHAEPEPQGAPDEGAAERGHGPGYPLAHARCAEEHLCPARSAEADGEDGEDPAVGAGGDCEAPEGEAPDGDEEGENKEGDGPCGRVFA